ncbi:MAG: hypothetical protein ACOC1F_09020, partial [Myxococcota bacterium]
LDLGAATDAMSERFVAAGVPGDWQLARLRHHISAEGTVRLDEIALVLGQGEPLAYRAVRLSLRGPRGQSVME